MNFVDITCPTCFESFSVTCPAPDEVPATVDYDCEICCRPMVIFFETEPGGTVVGSAAGLDD